MTSVYRGQNKDFNCSELMSTPEATPHSGTSHVIKCQGVSIFSCLFFLHCQHLLWPPGIWGICCDFKTELLYTALLHWESTCIIRRGKWYVVHMELVNIATYSTEEQECVKAGDEIGKDINLQKSDPSSWHDYFVIYKYSIWLASLQSFGSSLSCDMCFISMHC